MKQEEKDFDRERVKEVIAECFIKGYTKVRTMGTGAAVDRTEAVFAKVE